MKFLSYFVLSLLVFSCKGTDKECKEKIIGDWKFEEKLFQAEYYKITGIPAPLIDSNLGYSFFENNTYTVHTYSECYKKLKYIIENDSIRLQNPSDKKWQSFKFTIISPDTLAFISTDKIPKKFSRVVYHEPVKSKIDRILISSSGCYGECPVENLSINSNGNILFMGEDYTVKQGYYSANVNHDRFKSILTGFEKTGFSTMNNGYYATHTDDETISITFVRNDSIIKTIEDYGGEAPSEFIWAWLPLRNMPHDLKLKDKIVTVKDFPARGMHFKKGYEIGYIAKSEMFLLFTEIQKANMTSERFDKKYSIAPIFDRWTRQIYTDGRYFSLPEHPEQTLDLGYNFFERHNFDARLEPIE